METHAAAPSTSFDISPELAKAAIEARERRRDVRNVSNRHRSQRRGSGSRERHRDAVVTETLHFATLNPSSVDNRAVIRFLDFDAKRAQPAGHRRYSIALLDPQFLEAGEPRRTLGRGSGYEKGRKFVDSQRHEARIHVDSAQPRTSNADIRNGLLASHLWSAHLDVGTHGSQDVDDARTGRVNADVVIETSASPDSNVARITNAAEDRSAGTSTSVACSACPPCNEIAPPLVSTATPMVLSMRSVWSRVSGGFTHRGRAVGIEPRQKHCRLHLGTCNR